MNIESQSVFSQIKVQKGMFEDDLKKGMSLSEDEMEVLDDEEEVKLEV